MRPYRLPVAAIALVLALGAITIHPNSQLSVALSDAQGGDSHIWVDVDNRTVADTAKYTLSFDLGVVWQDGGYLNVTFSEGYDLENLELTVSLTGEEGDPGDPNLCIDNKAADFALDPATRNLSVTPKWTNSECPKDSKIDLVIQELVNPETAGPYTFKVTILAGDYSTLQVGKGLVEVEADDPSKLIFSLQPPAQVKAGESFEVSVEAHDDYGNLADLEEGMVLVLGTDADFIAALTSTNPGNFTFTVRVNQTGEHSMWASHPSLGEIESDYFSVGAGDPDPGLSMIEADPDTIPADRETISRVIVRLKDEFGNLITQEGAVVCLALSRGAGILSSTEGSSGCGVAEVRADVREDGSFNASFVSETVGSVSVNASVDGMDLDIGVSINVTDSGAEKKGPAAIVLSAEHSNITADGESSTMVTAWLEDTNGKKLSLIDEHICIHISAGHLGGERGDCGDGYVEAVHEQNGLYSVSVISSTQAGIATITGKWSGLTNSTTVGFRPGEPSTLKFDPSAPDEMIVAGNNFTMNVIVLDAHGNRLDEGALEATLTIESGPEGGQIGGFTTIFIENGTGKFRYISINLHGEYLLRAEASNLTSATSELIMVYPLIDLASFNRAIQQTVRVTAAEDGNEVAWDPEAYMAIEEFVAGILVWRFNSPAEWIEYVEPGSGAYSNSTYLDGGADPDARYTLTLCVVTGEGCFNWDDSPAASILDAPGYEGLSEAELFDAAVFGTGDEPLFSGNLVMMGLTGGFAVIGGVAVYLWTQSRRAGVKGGDGKKFEPVEGPYS